MNEEASKKLRKEINFSLISSADGETTSMAYGRRKRKRIKTSLGTRDDEMKRKRPPRVDGRRKRKFDMFTKVTDSCISSTPSLFL